MRWGVVTFPGSNDDHDALYAIDHVLGEDAVSLWHKDRDLKGVDCVVLPGGFSYGDYLRCGAMARFSPVMESVITFARAGGLVWGICNGFQVLCEAGLLPGALIRNRGLRFVCTRVHVRVEDTDTPFTCRGTRGEVLTIPVKHGEGCYVADPAVLEELERNRQVVLRYVDASGRATAEANPNGSLNNIAGIVSRERNVFGLMPHPEHVVEKLVGGEDGLKLFQSVAAAYAEHAHGRAASVAPGH
ncbi:MAG TPA: phosphoribosylformylglycinamidine synthase subunit PurQ [Candidatus Acidoferrales bacterium]|nr:phosphoribosylformylglycinamidine synthase subunit PurQ [Candidatus Acidoferrales bacterium]